MSEAAAHQLFRLLTESEDLLGIKKNLPELQKQLAELEQSGISTVATPVSVDIPVEQVVRAVEKVSPAPRSEPRVTKVAAAPPPPTPAIPPVVEKALADVQQLPKITDEQRAKAVVLAQQMTAAAPEDKAAAPAAAAAAAAAAPTPAAPVSAPGLDPAQTLAYYKADAERAAKAKADRKAAREARAAAKAGGGTLDEVSFKTGDRFQDQTVATAEQVEQEPHGPMWSLVFENGDSAQVTLGGTLIQYFQKAEDPYPTFACDKPADPAPVEPPEAPVPPTEAPTPAAPPVQTQATPAEQAENVLGVLCPDGITPPDEICSDRKAVRVVEWFYKRDPQHQGGLRIPLLVQQIQALGEKLASFRAAKDAEKIERRIKTAASMLSITIAGS